MFTDYAIQTLHRQRTEGLSTFAHDAERRRNAIRQHRASQHRDSRAAQSSRPRRAAANQVTAA